jgi:hypothetical protein
MTEEMDIDKKLFKIIKDSIDNYFKKEEKKKEKPNQEINDKEKPNQEINKKEKPNHEILKEINSRIVKRLQIEFDDSKFSIIIHLFYKENPETKFYFTSQTFYRQDFETKTYNYRISNVKEKNKKNCICIENLKYFIFISLTFLNVKTNK